MRLAFGAVDDRKIDNTGAFFYVVNVREEDVALGLRIKVTSAGDTFKCVGLYFVLLTIWCTSRLVWFDERGFVRVCPPFLLPLIRPHFLQYFLFSSFCFLKQKRQGTRGKLARPFAQE